MHLPEGVPAIACSCSRLANRCSSRWCNCHADCGFHDSSSWLNATSVAGLGASMSAINCSFTNHVTGPSVRYGLMRIEDCTFANNSRFDWGLYGEGFIDPEEGAPLKIDQSSPQDTPLPLENTPAVNRMLRIADASFAALREV